MKEVRQGTAIANNSLVSPCFLDDKPNSNPVGKLVAGQISDFLDIAIMQPSLQVNNFNGLPGPFFPYRILTRIHEDRVNLQFWGNGSKEVKTGLVKNISSNQIIKYSGISDVLMFNLIQIEKCAVAGDSGAAVCDFQGNFVGIIIGSDTDFTYVQSAFTIENKSPYTFPKS